jgi:hypothetical protein
MERAQVVAPGVIGPVACARPAFEPGAGSATITGSGDPVSVSS